MANYCNNHFNTVAEKMALKIPTAQPSAVKNNPQINESIFLNPISTNEIVQHISSLKNNSAPGIDGIKAYVINKYHLYIVEPLKHIIKYSNLV